MAKRLRRTALIVGAASAQAQPFLDLLKENGFIVDGVDIETEWNSDVDKYNLCIAPFPAQGMSTVDLYDVVVCFAHLADNHIERLCKQDEVALSATRLMKGVDNIGWFRNSLHQICLWLDGKQV